MAPGHQLTFSTKIAGHDVWQTVQAQRDLQFAVKSSAGASIALSPTTGVGPFESYIDITLGDLNDSSSISLVDYRGTTVSNEDSRVYFSVGHHWDYHPAILQFTSTQFLKDRLSLIQFWIITSDILWHSTAITGNDQDSYPWYSYKFEYYQFKIEVAFSMEPMYYKNVNSQMVH